MELNLKEKNNFKYRLFVCYCEDIEYFDDIEWEIAD